MKGYRKFAIAIVSVVCLSILAIMGKLDVQAATSIGGVAGAFFGTNLLGEHKGN